MYNKQEFSKLNDKKVLHKVKKHWVVMSMALLGMLGVGAASHVQAHADSTPQGQSSQPQQNQKQHTYTLTNDHSSKQITAQAHQLTNQLVQHQMLTADNRAQPNRTTHTPHQQPSQLHQATPKLNQQRPQVKRANNAFNTLDLNHGGKAGQARAWNFVQSGMSNHDFDPNGRSTNHLEGFDGNDTHDRQAFYHNLPYYSASQVKSYAHYLGIKLPNVSQHRDSQTTQYDQTTDQQADENHDALRQSRDFSVVGATPSRIDSDGLANEEQLGTMWKNGQVAHTSWDSGTKTLTISNGIIAPGSNGDMNVSNQNGTGSSISSFSNNNGIDYTKAAGANKIVFHNAIAPENSSNLLNLGNVNSVQGNLDVNHVTNMNDFFKNNNESVSNQVTYKYSDGNQNLMNKTEQLSDDPSAHGFMDLPSGDVIPASQRSTDEDQLNHPTWTAANVNLSNGKLSLTRKTSFDFQVAKLSNAYRYVYQWNGSDVKDANGSDYSETLQPAEDDNNLPGHPSGYSYYNPGPVTQKANQDYTYQGKTYHGTITTNVIELAKNRNTNEFDYSDVNTGHVTNKNGNDTSKALSSLVPNSDKALNQTLPSPTRSTGEGDFYRLSDQNDASVLSNRSDAPVYYGKYNQYQIQVAPKKSATIYHYVDENDGSGLGAYSVQQPADTTDSVSSFNHVSNSGYHVNTSIKYQGQNDGIKSDDHQSDQQYRYQGNDYVGNIDRYTVEAIPAVNANQYTFHYGNSKTEIVNVPQAYSDVPEIPNDLSSNYYFDSNNSQNKNWNRPGNSISNQTYQINGKSYYGNLAPHNVYLTPVKQNVPMNIIEFTYTPTSGSNQGKKLVIGTQETRLGQLKDSDVKSAYSDWSKTTKYYVNAKPLGASNAEEVASAPNQNYEIGNTVYNGPTVTYQVALKPAEGGNQNGINGQPNVPVNGDHVIGHLAIPVYKGANGDFSNLVGQIPLNFNTPLDEQDGKAVPDDSNPIQVGSIYNLSLNEPWMQNYIRSQFFDGDGYRENDASLTSKSSRSDFTNEQNPSEISLQFKNVATVVSDNGDPTKDKNDNHLDLWMGVDGKPSDMRDVARVYGRLSYEPQSNPATGELPDFTIDSIDWHKTPQNNLTGDQDLQADAVNSADAKDVTTGNTAKAKGNPVSLHYTFATNETAHLFYSNVDGDLIDANKSDKLSSPRVISNIDGHNVEGGFGHVIVWKDGPHAGEALSDASAEKYQDALEPFAQRLSNQDPGVVRDGSNLVNSPLKGSSDGIDPKYSIDYAPRTFKTYTKDPNGDAIIFDNRVRSTANPSLNITNGNQFSTYDSVNKLNGKSDLPLNNNGNPVHFVVAPAQDHDPIKNGDSAFFTPFADQLPHHRAQDGSHWFSLDPQHVDSDVKPGYVPMSDYMTEHGTFDKNGMFVPDTYESTNEPTNLKWGRSKVNIVFVKVHDDGTTSDENATVPYYPSVKHDDYIGKNVPFTSQDYAKFAPSDLTREGYRLDVNANGARLLDPTTQGFAVPNGNGTAYVYVSKAGSNSNVPSASDRYEPVHAFNVNPNFQPGQRINSNNNPFEPIPSDVPDTPENPNANHHHNVIPSPNHHYFDQNNPSAHGGMVPEGPYGWLPSNEVPAVQASFPISFKLAGNDGGRQMSDTIPISIDINYNQVTNKTYTISNQNIREAIVNYALSHGYTDKDGQAQDLVYDSIMRTPNSAYRPIQYQIQNDGGKYKIVLVNGNTDAGQFMYTPSNAIINYEGAVYQRNASDQMILMDPKTHQPIMPGQVDAYNRPNVNGDDSTSVESVLAEGYQGMQLNLANKDIRQLFTATGWSVDQMKNEKMAPFTLEGFDKNYFKYNDSNAPHNSDKKYNPTIGQGGDLIGGLVFRHHKYHNFYNQNSFNNDLVESDELNDEKLENNQIGAPNQPNNGQIVINGLTLDYNGNGSSGTVSYKNSQGSKVDVGTYSSTSGGTLTYNLSPNNNNTTLTNGTPDPNSSQYRITDPHTGNLMIDPTAEGLKPNGSGPSLSSVRLGMTRIPVRIRRQSANNQSSQLLNATAGLVNDTANRTGQSTSSVLNHLEHRINHLANQNVPMTKTYVPQDLRNVPNGFAIRIKANSLPMYAGTKLQFTGRKFRAGQVIDASKLVPINHTYYFVIRDHHQVGYVRANRDSVEVIKRR